MRLPIYPALFIALLGSMPALAQQDANHDQMTTRTVDERTRMAGTLKDLHGELNEQLRALSKLNGQVDRIAAPRIAEIKEEIGADLARVEQALDRVSATDKNSYADVREAMETFVREMRASLDTRNTGLKEAFGNE